MLTQIIGSHLSEEDQEFVSEHLAKLLDFFKSENGGEVIRLTVSELRDYLAK